MHTKLVSGIIIALLIFFLFLNNGYSQEKTEGYKIFDQSFDSFNQKANYRSDDLLFRLFQFKGKYNGVYQYTDIKQDGNSSTVRVTPFAYQNSRRAKLSAEKIDKLKQKLLDFSFSQVGKEIEPKDEELYTAFIFQNKGNFVRLNFSGQIPLEIQGVLELLEIEFEKADKESSEKFWAEGVQLREKYGEWEKNSGVVLPAEIGSLGLKNENVFLLYLKGLRLPETGMNQIKIPVFYVLIFHTNGRVVGSGGLGGRSIDPISRYGISWTISEKSYKPEKQFIADYNAIEKTLKIEGQTYKLDKGNLFIVKIGDDWKPKTEQLKIFLDEPTDHQKMLDHFKEKLRDDSLELRNIK